MIKIEFTIDSLFPPRLVFETVLLRLTNYKPILSDEEAQKFLREGQLDMAFMGAPAHLTVTGVEGK